MFDVPRALDDLTAEAPVVGLIKTPYSIRENISFKIFKVWYLSSDQNSIWTNMFLNIFFSIYFVIFLFIWGDENYKIIHFFLNNFCLQNWYKKKVSKFYYGNKSLVWTCSTFKNNLYINWIYLMKIYRLLFNLMSYFSLQCINIFYKK